MRILHDRIHRRLVCKLCIKVARIRRIFNTRFKRGLNLLRHELLEVNVLGEERVPLDLLRAVHS